MVYLTEQQETEINKSLMALIKNAVNPSGDNGMYYLWDYLEEHGYPPHVISQFIDTRGETLVNKAILSLMVDL